MKDCSLSRARALRKKSTDAERKMWSILRNRELCRYKFRRQYPVGRYIVDFVCLWKRLIVELDGSQHAIRERYDAKRTADLQSMGYRVIRFWNNVVMSETENVVEVILRELS